MRWNKRLKLTVAIVILMGILFGSWMFWWYSYGKQVWEQFGYSGLIGRPGPPYSRTRDLLWGVQTFCFAYKPGENGQWPSIQTLANEIGDLVIDANQPYSGDEVYILKIRGHDQERLLSSCYISGEEGTLTDGELRLPVALCAMASHQTDTGKYRAYETYPAGFASDIGEDAWRTWYFLSTDNLLINCVVSDIPPVPGCLAVPNISMPWRGRFYYPPKALELLKKIYPDVNVPAEQIITGGEIQKGP